MNVLHITSDYLPNPLWGMGWHVKYLVNALKREGCNVYIGAPSKSNKEGENILTTDKKTDEEYLSKEPYEIFSSFLKFNKWQEALANKIIDSGIDLDIVHCHNWMSWITAKKIKLINPKIKIVTTFHLIQKQYDTMSENPIPKYHDEIISIENEILKESDRVILLSERQERLLKEKYNKFDSKKNSIIPLGSSISEKNIEELLKKKGNERCLEISFVGRVEKDKGIFELLNVFEILRKKYNNIKLNVLGKGSKLDELKKKYPSKNIFFHGFVSRKKIKEVLEKTSIFCLPSYSESGATVVIEAMSFGAVPICSKGNSMPNLYIEGIEGLKIPLISKNGVDSPQEKDILTAFEELLNDKVLRNKFSRNAYNAAKDRYSMEQIGKKTKKVYEELLKSH